MAQAAPLVGIDVAKTRLDVHLHPAGEAFTVANHPTGWRELSGAAAGTVGRRSPSKASGGYEKPLARHLVRAGFRVHLLNPAQVRAFARGLGRHAKTDPIDALMIARRLEASIEYRAPYQPDPFADRLQALVTYRAKLVRERTALESYQDTLEEPTVRRLVRARLAGLRLAVVRLERAAAELIVGQPAAAARCRQLTSVPGVGPVLAATLLALLPELGRVSPKVAAALVGVAPYSRQSGRRDRGGRCRGGRPLVRAVLYMATLAAIRCRNPKIAGFYDRLRRAGKPAIVAAMRKLLTILNAIPRDHQPWITHA